LSPFSAPPAPSRATSPSILLLHPFFILLYRLLHSSSSLRPQVRQPQLLLYATESLADNWAALQRLLGVPFEATLAMTARWSGWGWGEGIV
jgi:hypothetical protein